MTALTARKEFQMGFRNCEMQSFVICDRRATSAPSVVNTDFRGGLFFSGQSDRTNADNDKSAGKQVAGSSLQEEYDSEAWFQVAHPDDLPTTPQTPKPSRRKPPRKPPREPSRKFCRKQSQPDLDDSEGDTDDKGSGAVSI